MVTVYIPIDNFTKVSGLPLNEAGMGLFAWIFTMKSEDVFVPISPFIVVTFTINNPLSFSSSVEMIAGEVLLLNLPSILVSFDRLEIVSLDVLLLEFESDIEPKLLRPMLEPVVINKNDIKNREQINIIIDNWSPTLKKWSINDFCFLTIAGDKLYYYIKQDYTTHRNPMMSVGIVNHQTSNEELTE